MLRRASRPARGGNKGCEIHAQAPARHTRPVNVILIALGGALGSVCRYALSAGVQRFTSPLFPYGTFVVNVAGCLAFGVIIGAARDRIVLDPPARAFLLVGILGGFTTFSTFTYETFVLLQAGEPLSAFLNAGGQLACGLAALWLGYVVATAL